MKKIFICLIAILMLVIPVQTGLAASEFSLINGDLTEKSAEFALLQEFFQSMQISASFDAGQNKYSLSGNATVTGSSEYISNNATGSDSGKGEIFGEFDPQSGEYKGQYSYSQTFSGKFNDGNGTYSATVYILYGEFAGISNPGETSVNLEFKGTKMVYTVGGSVTESQIALKVLFSISGALPITEPEETEEPEEPQITTENGMQELYDRVKVPARDSGVRFSDFTGQVEVCFPLGYDENGMEVYDEEAWTSAKLDMALPYGTKIKTSDNSKFLISFPEMTSFESKKEGIIILEKDPEVDPGPSTTEIMFGIFKINMKAFFTGKDIPKNRYFDDEMSVSGIKGTTFVLDVNNTSTTLKVIEGIVEFKAKADETSELIEAGEMISATKDGLGKIENFDIDEELSKWEDIEKAEQPGSFPPWLIAVIGAVVFAAAVIVIVAVSSRRKKRLAAKARPYVPAQSAYPPEPCIFCTKCGEPLASGVAFCAKCGKKT